MHGYTWSFLDIFPPSSSAQCMQRGSCQTRCQKASWKEKPWWRKRLTRKLTGRTDSAHNPGWRDLQNLDSTWWSPELQANQTAKHQGQRTGVWFTPGPNIPNRSKRQLSANGPTKWLHRDQLAGKAMWHHSKRWLNSHLPPMWGGFRTTTLRVGPNIIIYLIYIYISKYIHILIYNKVKQNIIKYNKI